MSYTFVFGLVTFLCLVLLVCLFVVLVMLLVVLFVLLFYLLFVNFVVWYGGVCDLVCLFKGLLGGDCCV